MQNIILKIFIFLAFFLMLPNFVSAADRFMATTGINVGDCASEAAPCLTLQYSMSKMVSGDTLLIDDGDYTTASNAINQFNFPPSGTPELFTTIRAKNIPGVNGIPFDQPLKVRFIDAAYFGPSNYPLNNSNLYVQYVKFWGLRWNGVSTYTNWDHIYFKQVASQGVTDGNSAAFSITGQSNLLEDCVAFGKGRYKFLFYNYSRELQSLGDGNNLCRRCIVRHDWAKKEDAGLDPIAAFSSYYNRGTALLNSIVIDSDKPEYWMNNPGEISGAFYQPMDDGAHALIVRGSIILNAAMSISNLRTGSSGHIFDNVSAVNVAGGIGAQGGADLQHLTFVNVGTNLFNFRSPTQIANILTPNYGVQDWSGAPVTISNSILNNISGNGINVSSDYMAVDNISGTSFVAPAATPTHLFSGPQPTSLKYPVRIEAGSPLATAGSAGGQIGAKITNKLGIDGTFKGDPNWNTEQGSLWPWPLEDWVQAEMRTSDYAAFCAPFEGTAGACPSSFATDAYRGFASAGVDAWGQPVTLTKYIWQSLGNQIPCDIYVTCSGDATAPSAPTGLGVI